MISSIVPGMIEAATLLELSGIVGIVGMGGMGGMAGMAGMAGVLRQLAMLLMGPGEWPWSLLRTPKSTPKTAKGAKYDSFLAMKFCKCWLKLEISTEVLVQKGVPRHSPQGWRQRER